MDKITKSFEINKDLFKVEDNYVCVSDEEIKEGDWVLETLNKVIFRVINEGNDYAKSSFKKIINSTQFINESIPILNIEDETNEIKSIEVEYEEYIEENTGNELKWVNKRPVILPNGKIKCKINYAL